jgi:hypothetical protein
MVTKQQFIEHLHHRADILRRHKLIEPPFLPVPIDEGRAFAQSKRKDNKRGGKMFW